MPILLTCADCQTRLRVPDKLAGKQAPCPKCKAPLQIPSAEAEPEAESEADLDEDLEFVPDLPSRPRKRKRPVVSEPDADEVDSDDDPDYDDVDPDDIAAEVVPRRLPKTRKKKKPTGDKASGEKVYREHLKTAADKVTHWGDVLVWVFLLALSPLMLAMVWPSVPLDERIFKTVENQPDLLAEYEEYGPQHFLSIHEDLTLAGAHLARDSDLHYLYALLTTGAFLLLLNAMRHRTRITATGLLITGLFTGTIGIMMLLAFQYIAIMSLHIRFVGFGVGGLIVLLIKFIGFSYLSALDPNSGFILSFIGFTCGVGLCEEVCKAVPLYYYLRRTQNSDWRGTCLIGIASGVGFGISEALTYSSEFYNGIEPALMYWVRFLSCVSIHAILSGSVALLMYGNQEYIDGDTDWPSFLFGGVYYLLIAILLHGLYDTLLKQHLEIVALLIALGAFGWLAFLAHYYWDYDPTPSYVV